MFDSYYRQFFSLPNTVIYYITQKPSNPKGYQKLIQTCKYFFTKNPILVFHCLELLENGLWNDNFNCTNRKSLNCKNIVAKLWVTEKLFIWPENSTNTASNIIPKLYKIDILNLVLIEQILYLDEFKLFSLVSNLYLRETAVLSKSNTLIPIEKIIECFPQLDEFDYTNSGNVSCDIKMLLKIPNFLKIQKFGLSNVSDSFDIGTCYNEYIKKNKSKKITLFFSHTISEAYKNRLEIIVDEILQTELPPPFKIPNIYYPGMDPEKRTTLLSLAFPK